MPLKYDGFYYYTYNNAMPKECMKFYSSGVVKRLLWNSCISDEVEKSFFYEDCITASITSSVDYSFQLEQEDNDFMFYEYKTLVYDKLSYRIIYANGFAEEREYKYYKTNVSFQNAKKNETRKKEVEFSCIVCNNKFIIFPKEKYDAFVCRECRSIYTYEWVSNKLQINIIKKNKKIPHEIKELLDFFQLTDNEIDLDAIKTKYRELLSQYHPDKVSNLGIEIKELAERKTKEIIRNYNKLSAWAKNYI
jgi:hypothetical protein